MKRNHKIFLAVLLLNLILVGSISSVVLYSIFPAKLVHVPSASMENGNWDSIDKEDYVKIVKDDRKKDITTYVEGVENGYRKAGSYGDVICFRPNGDHSLTPIIHRAVVYLRWNSTTYDPDTRNGGGFDIPSMALFNVLSTFIIEEYEWPKRPDSMDETIDIRSILNRFKASGITPHSGYLTKGDDNDHVDQVSSFGGADPQWIQVVRSDWIIGKFSYKLMRDPLDISCCISWFILPITIGIGVFVLMKEFQRKKDLEHEPQHDKRRNRDPYRKRSPIRSSPERHPSRRR